jgi:hypothetical protein
MKQDHRPYIRPYLVSAESMRQQLNITILLIIVLCTALFIKVIYFPKLYGHNAYYFISTFWICGSLLVIFFLNMLWQSLSSHKSQQTDKPLLTWPNRRETFRIIYPSFIRPKLVLERADNQDLRHLEFPIIDLSQEGSCFLNDGSLGAMNRFSGHIRFDNGERIKVTGQFIREQDQHISVRFTRAIDWSTLLEEQRRVLSHLRPAR